MNSEYLMPEELDKLQTTLVEHMQESGSMPLDAAHGFLTAVAAHREQMPAEVARAHVLGAIANEEGIDPILKKFQEQVQRDLESGEYGPLIMQMPRDDGSMLPLPYGWCEGYAQGMAMLGEEAQDQVVANKEASDHMSLIFVFLGYGESQMFDPPDEEAHRQAVSELGESAVFLYRWWQSQMSGGTQ
jgi:yecA family protein